MRSSICLGILFTLLCGGPAMTEGEYWRSYPDRPRLIVSPHELPQWRSKLKLPQLRGQLASLLSMCDAWLDPASPDYVDFRERKDSDRWRTRKAVYLVSDVLYRLAVAHLLTGEERYGRFCAQMLVTVCREDIGAQLGGTVYGQSYNTWFGGFDYAAVERAMAYAFDATCHLLSPEDRRFVAQHIATRYIDYTFGPESASWREHAATNQSFYRYWSAAIAMLSLYGELDQPQLDARLAECVRGIEAYFELQVDEDGGTFEGPGYGGVAVWACELAWIMRRAGYDHDLSANPHLRNIPRYYLQSILPGGGSISPSGQCFNDMSGPLLLAMCGLHRDRLARYALDLWGGGGIGRASDELVELLMWYDPALKAGTPAELGLSNDMVFRGLGTLVVRSGWGPQDYRFSLMAGSGYCGGCPDKGNFTLHALGESFVVDIGYGALPTERHNSLLIDGSGAVQNEYVRAQLADYDITNPAAIYGRLDLTASWHGSSRVWRHACFVRETPSHPWFVVIGDDLRMPEGDHEFTWVLVSGSGNRLEVEGADAFRIEGSNNALGVYPVSPAGVEMHQDVIEHRYMQEEAKTPTRDPGDFPRMRLTARGSQCRFVTVLCPHDRAPVRVASLDGDGRFGARVAWPSAVVEVAFRAEPQAGQTAWEVTEIPR